MIWKVSSFLNSILSNSSSSLYHFARFSLALSSLDFLLNMSVTFILRLYLSNSFGNLSKKMTALVFCFSFHFLQYFSIICLLLLIFWCMFSPLSILLGSHFPIFFLFALLFASFFLWWCFLIVWFSASITFHRQFILNCSTASDMSCCTWKRSLKKINLLAFAIQSSLLACASSKVKL